MPCVGGPHIEDDGIPPKDKEFSTTQKNMHCLNQLRSQREHPSTPSLSGHTDAFPWGAGHGTLRDTRK